MRENGVRHLPVLFGGKLVGVLSQRDLYFVETIAGVDTGIDVIADAMTADVFTVGPEETLREVVRTMAKHRYGSAVVVDHGKVVGIFTATDALDILADVMQ
jgi:acetoin utilization protein AcuB